MVKEEMFPILDKLVQVCTPLDRLNQVKDLISNERFHYVCLLYTSDAFGGDKVTMKNILGGKGAGLAEMTAAGMPVPQGFTITTEALSLIHI